MPRLRQIQKWSDLPTGGLAPLRESYEVEFKGGVDPKAWWELAKRMAAFANAFGGTIIVGATEKSGDVEYHGLDAAKAEEARRGYEEAHRDRLSPRPRIAIEEITEGGRVVLVVEVEPVPGQPVGAMVKSDSGKRNDEAAGWRFPVRSTRHAKPLLPEQLPMLTLAEVRRAAILLSRIRPDSKVFLEERRPPDAPPVEPKALRFREVDVEANTFSVEYQQGSATTTIRIPLDDVRTAWEDASKTWTIRVLGRIDLRPRYIGPPA